MGIGNIDFKTFVFRVTVSCNTVSLSLVLFVS